VMCCLTKAEADPLEVAMMATIPDAIASLTGTPNRTMIGMRMLAPPSPVSEPRKPTTIETAPSDNMFSMWLLSVGTWAHGELRQCHATGTLTKNGSHSGRL